MSTKIDWSSSSLEELNGQVSEQVRAILTKNFSSQAEYLSKHSDEQAKFADMGFDSLDVTEFSMALEETFQLSEIEEKDLKEMVSVQKVVEYIIAKKRTSASAAAAG